MASARRVSLFSSSKALIRASRWNYWFRGAGCIVAFIAMVLSLALTSVAAEVPRYAYVANVNDNTVSVFVVESSTGHFRHFGYARTCSFPRALTVVLDRFVYVACQTSQSSESSVWAFRINANGTLRKIWNYQTGGLTSGITSDPAGRFVYVTNWNSHTVTGFSVNATTGALTLVPGTPSHPASQPFSATVDPAGKYLLVASAWSGVVSVYRIATDGSLSQVPGSPFDAGGGTFAVAVDPTGRFVYAVNAYSNDVSAYRLDASTGALTTVAGSPFGAGTEPKSLAIDRTGKYLYVGNLRSGNVSAYAINQTSGAVSPISGSPFTAGRETHSLTIDATNRFLYATNSATQDVATFRISSTTGALTEVVRNRMRTRGNAYDLAFANGTSAVQTSNTFLLGAYFNEPTSTGLLAISKISADGSLSPMQDSPIDVSYVPQSSALDPFGRFVYFNRIGGASGVLDAYAISAAAGLTRVPGAPFTASPGLMAIDPSGRFLYVLNPGSSLLEYVISPATGAISHAQSYSVPADFPAKATALAVDPAGKYLFVGLSALDGSSNSLIVTLRIDARTGNVSSLGVSIRTPYPDALTLDVSGRFLYQVTGSTVISYRITPSLGALARTASLSSNAARLVTEPSGRFLYAASRAGVQGFSISPQNGALAMVPGAPFLQINPAVDSVITDFRGKYVYGASGRAPIEAGAIQSDGSLVELPGSPFPVLSGQVEVQSLLVRGTVH